MKLALVFLAMSQLVRASEIEVAVRHFYVDLKALSIRGMVHGEDVDHCGEVLTPSCKGAIDDARKGVQAWWDAAKLNPEKFENLKLPLTEGAIFTWVYESGVFTRIESVTEAGDRGYAKVRIQPHPTDGEGDWADVVILHRVGGKWLIDDILSGIEKDQPVSMRDCLVVPPPTNDAGKNARSDSEKLSK